VRRKKEGMKMIITECNRFKTLQLLMTFLFAYICISPVFAAEKEAELQPIEVIASPIIEGNEVTDYASQKTIVTDKQIEAINALDLPSALRWVPGVNISRYNLVGSYGGAQGGTIFIRGMGSERPGAEIQTLIDGKPIFQGVFTHPLMDLLSVDYAQRIEIYKSAQPVFLGNMSNGAVNIITKRRTTPGFESKSGVSYGSYDTFNSYLQHGGKIDRVDYYLVGSFKSSDGHRENADGQLQNYFGRFGYELSKEWDASFTAGYSDNWADDPGIEDSPALPVTPRFTTREQIYDLTVSNNYSWGNGYVKLYYDDGVVRWRQYDSSNSQVFYSNTDWITKGLKIEEKLHLWENGEIIAGYDYTRYGGEFKEIRPTGTKKLDDTFFYNSAPYLAVNHTFGKELKIIPSAGIRYNDSKYFGSDIGWQTGVVMRYRNTEFHAQYAKGFNLPGVYVVFNYTANFNQGDKWKDLDPEKIKHYEVGVSHVFNNWLSSDVTFFWDYGQDRLVFQAPPPRFENLENYHTRGFETTFTIKPVKDLDIFVGGTFLKSSPDDLPYAPETTLSAGLNYRPLERLQINMDSQYVSSRYVSNPRFPTANPDKVDSYSLLNAKVSYRITSKNSSFQSTVFLSGENLLDENYEYLKGYPAPGITVMVGFNVSI
jgi:outer membrane cobalamin receptor